MSGKISEPPEECVNCQIAPDETSFWWWKEERAWKCCNCDYEIREDEEPETKWDLDQNDTQFVAAYMADMRKRTGSVTDNNIFVSFFYLLLRDHIHPGDLEQLRMDVLKDTGETIYTNGYLARYAQDIVNSLMLHQDASDAEIIKESWNP